MDCCNYPEYRAPYGWEGAGGYTPYMQYSPYAPGYYSPLAHEHYARLAAAYRYDAYHPPQHIAPNDHVPPMEYSAYSTKEGRARRGQARRDALARSATHHLPLPHTPPLECGVSGRGGGYCEPHMWPHYQGNVVAPNGGGWHGMSSFNGGWMPRIHPNARDHIVRPTPELARPTKMPLPVCPADGRSTPYRPYEERTYSSERGTRVTPDFPPSNASAMNAEFDVNSRERYSDVRRPSPEVKKPPPIVPLPAFQQAFGSTEIGRFAEAFSRTEIAVDDSTSDTFNFEGFSDWDGNSEPLWSTQPSTREIKCEENF